VIAEVELAIKARIEARLSYLAAVITYQGDSGHIEDLLEELLRRLPAVAIVFSGGKFERVSGTTWRKHARFQVIVSTENKRSEEARRHGTATEKGNYTIQEDLESALIGHDLGLDITELVPGEVDSLFSGEMSGRSLAFYGIEFETSWLVERVEDTAGDMTEIEGTYTLPDAVEASASDLVRLT